MKKVVLSLSGGMDSTALLGFILGQGKEIGLEEVHVCNFQYGSKHNRYEARAFLNVVKYYRDFGFHIVPYEFDLSAVFQPFKSNLLLSGGDIPEGHYEAESMKATVVPGRNTIFASIMLGLAESVGAGIITLGVHAGDHHIYPDCRDTYITSLDKTIREASDHKVSVIAPLLKMNKTDILSLGYIQDPPAPFSLTRTCYKDQELSCGKCGSCQERLEAFAEIKITDPIKYETI